MERAIIVYVYLINFIIKLRLSDASVSTFYSKKCSNAIVLP